MAARLTLLQMKLAVEVTEALASIHIEKSKHVRLNDLLAAGTEISMLQVISKKQK